VVDLRFLHLYQVVGVFVLISFGHHARMLLLPLFSIVHHELLSIAPVWQVFCLIQRQSPVLFSLSHHYHHVMFESRFYTPLDTK